jgi:acetolactate synthase I/II/III large subunit
MMKLSDYVFEFVFNLGVREVFLLPGGGCMHLVDSLGRNDNLNPVCCLHEQAATIAADAYGQYTNNIGVALVTTGPGSTNAITGVAGSWIDSVPVLMISGQTKRQDLMTGRGVRQMGVQEVDIVSMVKSITKYAVTVMEPESIRYHLEKAVHLARNGRPGPVWIDIPLDVQGAIIDEASLKEFKPEIHETQEKNKFKSLKIQVARAIELLNKSKRPVILAGNGIRLSGAKDDFLKLIKKLNIPVLTTWKSIDFIREDDPLYFGRPGSIAHRGANFVQQNSDWIAVIGARLDLPQVGFNYPAFAREAKKIIVDIDQAEINKLDMDIDVPVCADASDFIREFTGQSNKLKEKVRGEWITKCSEWKNKYPVVLPEYKKSNDYINTYHLVDVLSEVMSADDVLVPGSSGSCSEITLQAFRVKEGQRILNNPGLGAMGFGLPASIGACIASGGKKTITIIGDGGLQHNIQDLETIARLRLPIKLFILNNNGYASIRTMQANHFNANYVCCDQNSGLTFPVLVGIAHTYKIAFMKLDTDENLEHQVRHVLEEKGPVLCEVLVDPKLLTAPKLSSEVKSDGTIVSKPLEDLWPFLDREEFATNMFIDPIKK